MKKAGDPKVSGWWPNASDPEAQVSDIYANRLRLRR
jgi:hypothetical protein